MNYLEIIGILLFVIGVCIGLFVVIIELTGQVEKEIEWIDCYDRYSNKIIGENCEEETNYYYDFENRLIKVRLPGRSTVKYTYDYKGRRVMKAPQYGDKIVYIYDKDDNLIATYEYVCQTNFITGGTPMIDKPIVIQE